MTTHTPEEQARNRGLVVAALRSGEFTQGHHSMQRNGKYCCLGVACRVAERHGVDVTVHADGALCGASLAQHPNVARWLGIFGIGPYGPARALAQDNDVNKHTFRQIARTIERVWGTDTRPGGDPADEPLFDLYYTPLAGGAPLRYNAEGGPMSVREVRAAPCSHWYGADTPTVRLAVPR